MFELSGYLQALIRECQSAFGGRLLYVGLQGSYLRGEAHEDSDIDVMVILDRFSVRDIRTDNVILPNNAGELYFEETDLDAFCEHLKAFDIRYVHPLFEHRWGQRVVRFYDPDGHILQS